MPFNLRSVVDCQSDSFGGRQLGVACMRKRKADCSFGHSGRVALHSLFSFLSTSRLLVVVVAASPLLHQLMLLPQLGPWPHCPACHRGTLDRAAVIDPVHLYLGQPLQLQLGQLSHPPLSDRSAVLAPRGHLDFQRDLTALGPNVVILVAILYQIPFQMTLLT